MSTLTHSHSIVISLILFTALTFSGCSSTNSDDTGSNPNFSSGNIAPGESYSFTFENEGTVEYYCSIHAPDMQGQITVSSSAESVARDTVEMAGESFQPNSLTIAPNTEVVWVNNADVDHTVVSGNPTSDGGGGDY